VNMCMVLAHRDFPPDIRVEKETRALLQAGHRVVIVCENLKGRPRHGEWKGALIIRLNIPPFIPRRLFYLPLYLTFYDPFWARVLSRVAERHHIDAFHVHDLPMAGTTLTVGKRMGLHVILDFHENYPASVRLMFEISPSLWRRLMYSDTHRWELYEKRCAMEADRVIVVVEEGRDRLVARGIPWDKIMVVSNTVDVDYFSSLSVPANLGYEPKDDFVISYVGGFAKDRGLDLAIEAMPEVIEAIPNARLLLVGDGGNRPELEALAKNLGLADKVAFTGWQSFHKIPAYVGLSDVCLVPHLSNPQRETTIPHKLFQYMGLGKPVVVSSCRPLKRIVEETGSGLIFEAGNSKALAETIVSLKEQERRWQLGSRGKEAVLKKYNWRKEADKLLGLYEGLSSD
jgi:glycosyltransferase involved in cell wall biosynthesis